MSDYRNSGGHAATNDDLADVDAERERFLAGALEVLRTEYDYQGNCSLDERIDVVFRDVPGWEAIDFYDVMRLLDAFFLLPTEFAPWKLRHYPAWQSFVHDPDATGDNQRYMRLFTMRELVDFLRSRATRVHITPAVVLGKSCLTAGAFLAVEQLARAHGRIETRLAPSTPIDECLHGTQLSGFWRYVRWLSNDRLPPPGARPRFFGYKHVSRRQWIAAAAVVLATVTGGYWYGTWLGSPAVGLVPLLIPAVVAAAVLVGTSIPVLPAGFRTFRDVARALTADATGAA